MIAVTTDPSHFYQFSSVLEKIVTHLLKYLEVSRLLSKNQHGFRPKLSTTTALTVLIDKMIKYTTTWTTNAVLCWHSDTVISPKEFNSVSHNILLEKLLNMTVDKFWLDDYLSGRSQAGRVNDPVSSKTDVLYGVTQGSILGPILFNIHKNYIIKLHQSHCGTVYGRHIILAHRDLREPKQLDFQSRTQVKNCKNMFS